MKKNLWQKIPIEIVKIILEKHCGGAEHVQLSLLSNEWNSNIYANEKCVEAMGKYFDSIYFE